MRYPTTATAPRVTSAPIQVRCRHELRLSPESDGQRVLVLDEARDRQFRLSADAARLLALLDGTKSSADVAAALGVGDASVVEQAVARLVSLGLVESTAPARADAGGRHTHIVRHAAGARRQRPSGRHRLPRSDYPPPRWRTPQPGRRWRVRPPGTVEFSFGDPGRILSQLRPTADLLASTAGQLMIGGVLAIAAGLLLSTWRERVADLSAPAPGWVFAALFVIQLATTFAHEFGHGVSLVRAGGRVRRLGMILLYGTPSFFCDVSHAWRLPPRRRVWVALAGVRVHLAVGAAAAIAASFAPPGPLRQLLSAMVAIDVLLALINLCPFVKFDGYIALVGWLDRPHLRNKSMAAVRDLVGRLVFGRGRRGAAAAARAGTTETDKLSSGWLLYGLACMVVTPVFVGIALLNYEPVLLDLMGTMGAATFVMLFGYLLLIPFKAITLASRNAVKAGVPAWRRLVGAGVLAAVLAGVFGGIPVPSRISSVYSTDASGAVLVVVPSDVDMRAVGAVELKRVGMMLNRRVAAGRICGPVRDALVDPGTGSPMLPVSDTPATPVRRRVVPVCVESGRAGTGGYARLSAGSVPLGRWLYLTFVKPATDRLF